MDSREPVFASDVRVLLRAVSDPRRVHAIVIVSANHGGDRRYGISPHRLARAVSDRAEVWVLPTAEHNIDFSNAWPDSIRPKRAVGGGAIRVIGARGWSAVIRTDTRTEQVVIDRILRGLADEPLRAWPPVVAVDEDAPASPVRPSAKESVSAGDGAVSSRHTSAVIERLREELAAAQEQIDELKEHVADLEATATATGRPVYSDPERQLRHEIELAWLEHLPESDREQWPLRDYVLGPHLLPLATNLASRERIVSVMVDVLTRRAYSLPARAVHPHHDRGAAGTVKVRPDGAAAYRAYIKSGSPGAARLLWWELVDGRVELAQVGHHDAALRTARTAG